MKDNPYFTLCEAVTWIAFRVPYKIMSLSHAAGLIGDFDLDAAEVRLAAAELKERLSHPKSGILIEGIDEHSNEEVYKTIPHTHFSEKIEFYLHDETIDKSSENPDDILSNTKYPQWKNVRVLKEDMIREWPEGVYVPEDYPAWPDKPYFNVQEAINALAYHDPGGPEKFEASQGKRGVNLVDFAVENIWARGKKTLQEAALAGKVTVLGLRRHSTDHQPIPATDWFTTKIDPEVLFMNTEEQLREVGASKTGYHPDGKNYWRDLRFLVEEIRAFHEEFYGMVTIARDEPVKSNAAKESKAKRIARYTKEAKARRPETKVKHATWLYFALRRIADNDYFNKADVCRYVAEKDNRSIETADNIRSALDGSFGKEWPSKA